MQRTPTLPRTCRCQGTSIHYRSDACGTALWRTWDNTRRATATARGSDTGRGTRLWRLCRPYSPACFSPCTLLALYRLPFQEHFLSDAYSVTRHCAAEKDYSGARATTFYLSLHGGLRRRRLRSAFFCRSYRRTLAGAAPRGGIRPLLSRIAPLHTYLDGGDFRGRNSPATYSPVAGRAFWRFFNLSYHTDSTNDIYLRSCLRRHTLLA